MPPSGCGNSGAECSPASGRRGERTSPHGRVPFSMNALPAQPFWGSAHTTLHRLLAVSLALGLASCSTTRSALSSPRSEELNAFVLIIQEMSDGHVIHSWHRATEINLDQYHPSSSLPDTSGQIVLASRRPRDCDEEHIACYRGCMKRRLPAQLGHIEYGSARHINHCNRTCLDAYQDCLDSQRGRALMLPGIDGAVDWLKRHRTELLVGTIIVVAGVTFVVASAGAGVVILAPLALMASSSPACEPYMTGAPT